MAVCIVQLHFAAYTFNIFCPATYSFRKTCQIVKGQTGDGIPVALDRTVGDLPQHFPNKFWLNSCSFNFLKRNFGMTVAENFVLERGGRVANLAGLGPPHMLPSALWYAHARILAVQRLFRRSAADGSIAGPGSPSARDVTPLGRLSPNRNENFEPFSDE